MSIYLEVVAAIRAFTCATVSEAEAAAIEWLNRLALLIDDEELPIW